MKRLQKIDDLLKICRTILATDIDEGFNLNIIHYKTETQGHRESDKEFAIVKNKRKFYTKKCKFYDVFRKKIRDVEVYVPYKQFVSECFKFKSNLENIQSN